MNKYKYLGKTAVSLSGYGLVNPKETIEVDFSINHPLFRKVKIKTSKKRK
jgi:hypothetical protein